MAADLYGATVYLQEKLKILMKKQSAMFEIMKHFSASLPLLLYLFSHGPIPEVRKLVTQLYCYIDNFCYHMYSMCARRSIL